MELLGDRPRTVGVGRPWTALAVGGALEGPRPDAVPAEAPALEWSTEEHRHLLDVHFPQKCCGRDVS